MGVYDISEAFERIEDELIGSMMRNFSRHRIEEIQQGFEWEQWQVLQLQALEKYRRDNQKKFPARFNKLNGQIADALNTSYQDGAASQERQILKAVQKGYSPPVKLFSGQAEVTGEFFKVNDKRLDALITATTSDMSKAEYSILRQADDQYRKIIFNAQVYANTGAGTYEKAVDMATKDFLKAGINSIEYKDGSRHSIEEYSRMALQTGMKRAYLQGEGEKRKEFGITTVILKKRFCACPKCLPFVGKVFIDDVWSGGRQAAGADFGISSVTGLKYPLLSQAIKAGLYHPNCRDTHSTYLEGISTPPEDSAYTVDELDEIAERYKAEQKRNYCENQAERYNRLSKYSLDSGNKRMYGARAKVWEDKADSFSEVIDLMSNSFRPEFEESKPLEIMSENKSMQILVKKVKNSKFNVVTDVENTKRNKAVRLMEKMLSNVIEELPKKFELPEIAVVDFEKHNINTDAIGGYDRKTGILYFNSKYDTVEKIVKYVNETAGMFANKTQYAPILHELGHKYYYDCIKGLAKSKNISYNEAKRLIDHKVYDAVEFDNHSDIFSSLSKYAKTGYLSGNYTEFVAECFSVKDTNVFAEKLLILISEEEMS